jgi:hypothetical protein
MKSLVLLVVFSIICSIETNAQVTYSISNGGISYSSGSVASNTFHGNLGISSLSGLINLEWELIEVNVPQGWEVSNCDPQICHPIGVTSAQFSLSGSSTIHGHFYPNGQSGSGYMKLNFKNVDDPGDQAEVVWHGYASGLSNGEVLLSQILVYPNPATDIINILVADNYSTGNFEIYDLTGKIVKYGNLFDNQSIAVFVGDLARGVYILRLHSDNGMDVLSKIALD